MAPHAADVDGSSLDRFFYGILSVPAGGFAHGNSMYIFYSVDEDNHSHETAGISGYQTPRLILAKQDHERNAPMSTIFDYLYEFSFYDPKNTYVHFNHACPRVVLNGSIHGLPLSSYVQQGGDFGVLVWLSSVQNNASDYREGSNLYLAYCPIDYLQQSAIGPTIYGAPSRVRTGWSFFAGVDETGTPRWGDDYEAVPVAENVACECSVALDPHSGCWLLLNMRYPYSVVQLRYAYQPWGPFFDAGDVYNPAVKNSDQINYSTGPEGQYAPYLIPRWFRGNSDITTIYYTLSTGRDVYGTCLMRADVKIDCVTIQIPSSGGVL